jgi:hypothetical protein
MLLLTMNPNYLLRDDLEYELASRGLSSFGDVQWLRIIFRAVQADGIPSQASHLPQGSIEELYRWACVKLCELESLNEQLDRSLPTPVYRIIAKVATVKNRVRHLDALCPEVAGNLQLDVSSLISRLAAVKLVLLPRSAEKREGILLS